MASLDESLWDLDESLWDGWLRWMNPFGIWMNRMDKIRDEKQKRDGKQKMDDSLCANGMDSFGILDESLWDGWLRWMNPLSGLDELLRSLDECLRQG